MESDCRCRGLSRFFFIGLLVVNLNAVGNGAEAALFVPIAVAPATALLHRLFP